MKLVKAGESHGKFMVGILTDVPAGITVSENGINTLLNQRNFAFGRSARQAIESDKLNAITGVRDGITIGNNVAFIIENSVSGDYGRMMDAFNADLTQGKLTAVRPGHADLPGVNRFALGDARNVLEGASARNTCLDVVGGAIALEFLKQLNVSVCAFSRSLGGIIDNKDYNFEQVSNVDAPFFSVNKNFESEVKNCVELCERRGDSVGGSVEIRVKGIKPGFGCYVSEKRVNSLIAQHITQIQAVKGIYFGKKPFGGEFCSEYADKVEISGNNVVIATSNSGGIDGGMTNGGEIIITVAVKPIPTTKHGVETIDIKSKKTSVSAKERADITAVFALCPILKSVVALALSEAVCERLGCDNMQNIVKRYDLI